MPLLEGIALPFGMIPSGFFSLREGIRGVWQGDRAGEQDWDLSMDGSLLYTGDNKCFPIEFRGL